MTGKELKKILDAMTEEELAMEVVFDADYICSENGEELYTPSDVYAEDDEIVVESEAIEVTVVDEDGNSYSYFDIAEH